MFCPICKAEYRPGFTRCSDCDVNLVETLEMANAATPEQMNAVLLWSGSDPQAFVAVRDALDWAKIFHFAQTRESGLFPNLKGQLYSVLVHQDDYRAAEAVLQTVPLVDTADSEDEQGSEDEKDPEELPEDSDELQEADSEEPAPDDIPQEEFREAKATAEVWSGDNMGTAEAICMSLRENGIGSLVDEAEGKQRLRVMPDSESRAKEIVREVIEETPPE
jgi:hypothetical protein